MKRDDDELERFQGEKRSREKHPRNEDEDEGETSTEAHARVKDEHRERTRTTMRSSSGKRLKKIDERKNQDHKQNRNRDASPSLCYAESKRRGQVVSNNKTLKRRRKEPVREREVVQERGRTPEWLVNVMRKENGVDAKLIFEKVLTMSDVAKGQTRLLIPRNKILDMDFLNEKELDIIDQHYKKNRDRGLEVIMVNSRGGRWELNLRRWDMRSAPYYVWASGWSKVVAGNNLVENYKLRLWSFRSPGQLYFAFIPPDPTPPSPPSLVVNREFDELHISQTESHDESKRIFPVPVQDEDWRGLHLLAEVCEEMSRLEALQEANRMSSGCN